MAKKLTLIALVVCLVAFASGVKAQSSTGAAELTGCASHTTYETCSGAACYWDVWETTSSPAGTQCYDTVGQSVTDNGRTCAYYQTVASWEQACEAHGCTVFGDQCLATYGSGSTSNGQVGVISQSNIATWTNVQSQANSDIFSFDTLVPLSVSTTPNTWWAAVVGSYEENIAGSVAENFAHCTSFHSMNGAAPIYPVDFAFNNAALDENPEGLEFNIVDYIARFGNAAFSYATGTTGFLTGAQSPATYNIGPNGDPFTETFDISTNYQEAMRKSFGNFEVSTTKPVRSLTVDAGTEGTPRWGWQLKLSDIADCPGVYDITAADGISVTRVIPTGVVQLSSTGGASGVWNTFYATQSAGGSLTISPNSRYRAQVALLNNIIAKGDCTGANEAQKLIKYKVTYFGVLDPTITVGPRSISDLHLNRDGAAFSTQYNQEFYDFEPTVCDSGTGRCTFGFKTRSECRVLTADGQAFIHPSASINMDKRTTLHSGISDADYFATAKNFNFYVDVYNCPSSGTCVRANAATDGSYDMFVLTLADMATPKDLSNQISASYEVTGGLLDAAGVTLEAQTDLTHFRPLVVIPGQLNGVDQLPTELTAGTSSQSQTISARGMFAPMIRLRTENLATTDLRLGIGATHMSITPVQYNPDAGAAMFETGATKYYSDIKPLMHYVPKNTQISCASCKVLPIVEALEALTPAQYGVDGWAASMSNLASLWPTIEVTGLKVFLTYFVGSQGTSGGSVPPAGGVSRRLLQALDPNYQTTYNQDGSISQVYFVKIDYTDTYSNTTNTTTTTSTTTLTPVTCVDPTFSITYNTDHSIRQVIGHKTNFTTNATSHFAVTPVVNATVCPVTVVSEPVILQKNYTQTVTVLPEGASIAVPFPTDANSKLAVASVSMVGVSALVYALIFIVTK